MIKNYYPDRHPWKGIRPFKRHSLVLLVAGGVYVLIGISYISTGATPARRASLVVAERWMSFEAWGFVWILAGVLAIVSSRWPPVSKTWGYMVLTGLSAAWAGFFLMGMIFADAPDSNATGTFAWGLVGFLWWAISGLLNPNDVRLHDISLETGFISDPLDNPR
jgi:hypothetical protein